MPPPPRRRSPRSPGESQEPRLEARGFRRGAKAGSSGSNEPPNNNNYKALRMRPPHDPLQTLSGECSARRREHRTPHGTRKTPRPDSSYIKRPTDCQINTQCMAGLRSAAF
jgi:hypothetical protein